MKLSNRKCLHCGSNPVRMKRIVTRLVRAEVAAADRASQDTDIERELDSARAAFKNELQRISA